MVDSQRPPAASRAAGWRHPPPRSGVLRARQHPRRIGFAPRPLTGLSQPAPQHAPVECSHLAHQTARDPADAEQARARRGCRSPGRSRRRRPARCRRSRGRARPARSAWSGAWMCCTTQASQPSSWRARRKSTIRSNARPDGAHALDRRDLAVDGEDRLDLQRAAEPGLRGADAPAAAQELERVDREPDLRRVDRGAHARGRPRRCRRPPRAAARAGERGQADDRRRRSACRSTSMRRCGLRALRSVAAWRADSTVPEIPPEMWIETMSRPASTSGS